MRAVFVVPAIFYFLATLCGLAIWVYSAVRTRLSFAYVYVVSYALALLLFGLQLILTLEPRITSGLLGSRGPEIWVYIFTGVQAVDVLIGLIALVILVQWIHRQVARRKT